MADGFYRLNASIVSRKATATNPNGSSAVAKAAYDSCSKLHDERNNRDFDYTNKGKETHIHSELMLPDNAPAWMADREKLWNAVERIESSGTRPESAQLARAIILSVPYEVDAGRRVEIVRGFVQEFYVDKGMVADVSLHRYGEAFKTGARATPDERAVTASRLEVWKAEGLPFFEKGHAPDDGDAHILISRNKKNEITDYKLYQPHAHVLLTMRDIEGEGFGNKNRSWNARPSLIKWRKGWADHLNDEMIEQGKDARFDHRSYAAQGIDREPTKPLGPIAARMERRGQKSFQGNELRAINASNAYREDLKGQLHNAEQLLHQLDSGDSMSFETEGPSVAHAQASELSELEKLAIRHEDARRALEAAKLDQAKVELDARIDTLAAEADLRILEHPANLAAAELAKRARTIEDDEKLKAEATRVSQERRYANADITDHRVRYADALQAFDPTRPYTSLTKVASREAALFAEGQDRLIKQEAAAVDPVERELIVLRRLTESAQYQAAVYARCEKRSGTNAGVNSPEALKYRGWNEVMAKEADILMVERADLKLARQKHRSGDKEIEGLGTAEERSRARVMVAHVDVQGRLAQEFPQPEKTWGNATAPWGKTQEFTEGPDSRAPKTREAPPGEKNRAQLSAWDRPVARAQTGTVQEADFVVPPSYTNEPTAETAPRATPEPIAAREPQKQDEPQQERGTRARRPDSRDRPEPTPRKAPTNDRSLDSRDSPQERKQAEQREAANQQAQGIRPSRTRDGQPATNSREARDVKSTKEQLRKDYRAVARETHLSEQQITREKGPLR